MKQFHIYEAVNGRRIECASFPRHDKATAKRFLGHLRAKFPYAAFGASHAPQNDARARF